MTTQFKKIFCFVSFFLLTIPVVSWADQAPNLQIIYDPVAFTAPVTLNIATSTATSSLPWEWQALSPAYDYSFTTTGFYDPSRPLTLKIYYPIKNNYQKQIFSYDPSSNIWRPLITTDSFIDQYGTATTDAISGRLMVLSNPDKLLVGSASWYKYKNGLFAASPDFPKGTVLRVYNLANQKSVDVTINDWGPDRQQYPDRVIDLDQVAFNRIASSSAGIISVRVEPLKITKPTTKQPIPQPTAELNLTASSAVIVSEKTGQVLWGKNEKVVAPLASLTKIVAIKTFLDTKPNLKKIVTYKKADEDYNNKYCAPGEAAKLKVKAGDTLTIENLLYSALVGSANNAVESLVRVSGLSRDKFIARMNTLVKKWGASSTHFVEPTGLSPDNVSSPLDYAIITKEAFTNPLLQKISTTPHYTFKTLNTKKAHSLTNTDQLLRENIYPLIGSKTGYLEEAGYCLMTRINASSSPLIAINFGSTSRANSFSDNEQLIRYGLRLLKK